MRFASLKKFLAMSAEVVLPALPLIACVGFRGIEAWKLWYEMSRFSALGAVAWMWALAFTAATVITIGGFDTNRSCRVWQILIDAANTVSSLILAVEAASEDVEITRTVPYIPRLILLFAALVVAQMTVAFLAHRARSVGRRLRHQLQSQAALPPAPVLPTFIEPRASSVTETALPLVATTLAAELETATRP